MLAIVPPAEPITQGEAHEAILDALYPNGELLVDDPEPVQAEAREGDDAS